MRIVATVFDRTICIGSVMTKALFSREQRFAEFYLRTTDNASCADLGDVVIYMHMDRFFWSNGFHANKAIIILVG
jgi:hypothetical protein